MSKILTSLALAGSLALGLVGCSKNTQSDKQYLMRRADVPGTVENLSLWGKMDDRPSAEVYFFFYPHSPARETFNPDPRIYCVLNGKQMKKLGFKLENTCEYIPRQRGN